MRLNRFDLTRYGKFSDLTVPFDRGTDGSPDLHVIYGPNEAGKSTFLSGWLDLLFQIPVRSPMDFLHSYKTMQLGATLDIDGDIHKITRVKKRDNSLLDERDTPIGESLLHGALRGLNRSSYAAMFSLNQHTLDEGGQSILASEGDLGELLFQASSGLTDLATQLDSLKESSFDFLNATGRKGHLKDLRKSYDELGERIKELDTAAPEFAKLSADRDAAFAAWKAACKAADEAQTKTLETNRLSGALPLSRRLARLDAQIAEFADIPLPPKGWLAELPSLDRDETEIATRLDTSEQSIKDLKDDLNQIPQDRLVLDVSSSIAAAEHFKSTYDTAVADLPKRTIELDGINSSIRDCLVQLGQQNTDPQILLLPAEITGRLGGLIENHSGVKTTLTSANAEVLRAQTNADNAAQKLASAGGSIADLGGLDGLVQTIRRDAPLRATDQASTTLAQTETDLHEKRIALAPWIGDDKKLAELISPARPPLEQLGAAIASATQQHQRDAETFERLTQEALKHQNRQAKLGNVTTATVEQAAQIRAQREQKWSHHRATLNAETADHFETAMRHDDQVTATLADQRAREQKAQEAAQNLIEANQDVEAAQMRLTKSADALAELQKSLQQIVSNTSAHLPKDIDAQTFLAWLDKLAAAQSSLLKRNEAQRKLAHCVEVADRSRASLLLALSQAGRVLPDATDLTFALETAQNLLDRTAQTKALAEADANARQELHHREKQKAIAQGAMDQWQTDWNTACGETWMKDTIPNVPEMRAILNALGQLRQHHSKATDLHRRIKSMQTNIGDFKKAVDELGHSLGMEQDNAPHIIWNAIIQRQREAQSNQNKRTELVKQLDIACKKHAEIGEKAEIHRKRTEEFNRFFNVATWPQARDALSRAGERAKLMQDRSNCSEDLCTQMNAATLQDAQDQLKGADQLQLDARAESLKIELETLRSEQAEADTKYRLAEANLKHVGGDAQVAQLMEQRQTLLLEMEEGARQHLQRRLGLLAVDASLREYRDSHRSGMLDRASAAFNAMSLGQYSGLASHFDGDREVLVALPTEGGSKQADQLSDGTRAQLYLALRIAGYHEFVQNKGPVPFIADDIMESFDDARTAKAMGLLSKMSESGQVIYLTHHAHVCEIAREACPNVHIHDLK